MTAVTAALARFKVSPDIVLACAMGAILAALIVPLPP